MGCLSSRASQKLKTPEALIKQLLQLPIKIPELLWLCFCQVKTTKTQPKNEFNEKTFVVARNMPKSLNPPTKSGKHATELRRTINVMLKRL